MRVRRSSQISAGSSENGSCSPSICCERMAFSRTSASNTCAVITPRWNSSRRMRERMCVLRIGYWASDR